MFENYFIGVSFQKLFTLHIHILSRKLLSIFKSPLCLLNYHHTSTWRLILSPHKLTPHKDTNQEIVRIIPCNGKREAVPIAAPIFFSGSPDSGNVQVGGHDELANKL